MTTFVGKILPRTDTAANWASVNPILGDGEIGFESDTNFRKTGNGSSSWSSLPYDIGHGRTLTAVDIPFSPAGGIPSTNVQDAIEDAAELGGGGGGGTITSVNGQTGPTVTLTAANVGAAPDNVAALIAACTGTKIVWNTVSEEWEMAATPLAAAGLQPDDFLFRIWVGPDEPVDIPAGDHLWWQDGDLIANTAS